MIGGMLLTTRDKRSSHPIKCGQLLKDVCFEGNGKSDKSSNDISRKIVEIQTWFGMTENIFWKICLENDLFSK